MNSFWKSIKYFNGILMHLYHLKKFEHFLKFSGNWADLRGLTGFISLLFPVTAARPGQGDCRPMEYGTFTAKLHVFPSTRSIQLQLWKAIQPSPMGFLVTLQRRPHHFLCSQACPKVGGSECIFRRVTFWSNFPIAQGRQWALWQMWSCTEVRDRE